MLSQFHSYFDSLFKQQDEKNHNLELVHLVESLLLFKVKCMLKNKNFKNFEQEVHNMNEVTNFLNEYDKIVSKYGTRE